MPSAAHTPPWTPVSAVPKDCDRGDDSASAVPSITASVDLTTVPPKDVIMTDLSLGTLHSSGTAASVPTSSSRTADTRDSTPFPTRSQHRCASPLWCERPQPADAHKTLAIRAFLDAGHFVAPSREIKAGDHPALLPVGHERHLPRPARWTWRTRRSVSPSTSVQVFLKYPTPYARDSAHKVSAGTLLGLSTYDAFALRRLAEDHAVLARLAGISALHVQIWLQVAAVPPPTPEPIGEANANLTPTGGHAIPLGAKDDWKCEDCGTISWRTRAACIRCFPWHHKNLYYLLGGVRQTVRLSLGSVRFYYAALRDLAVAGLLTHTTGIDQLCLLTRALGAGRLMIRTPATAHDPMAAAAYADPADVLVPLREHGWSDTQLAILAERAFGIRLVF
ncbi:hypothetical protein Q5752_005082 [Cryptotrichosporon argae]